MIVQFFRLVLWSTKNAFAQARPGAKAPPDNAQLYCYEVVRLIPNSDRTTGIVTMRLAPLALASSRWPTLFPNHPGPRQHGNAGKA